jgi:hypothetical protein
VVPWVLRFWAASFAALSASSFPSTLECPGTQWYSIFHAACLRIHSLSTIVLVIPCLGPGLASCILRRAADESV